PRHAWKLAAACLRARGRGACRLLLLGRRVARVAGELARRRAELLRLDVLGTLQRDLALLVALGLLLPRSLVLALGDGLGVLLLLGVALFVPRLLLVGNRARPVVEGEIGRGVARLRGSDRERCLRLLGCGRLVLACHPFLLFKLSSSSQSLADPNRGHTQP